MTPIACHHCGTVNQTPDPIPRDSECRECRRDLRCCLNCRFHDPAYNHSCREPDADPVTDKDRRNFCEFYSPGPAGRPGQASRADQARKGLEALFGRKPPAEPQPGDARARLEDLFRKRPADDGES